MPFNVVFLYYILHTATDVTNHPNHHRDGLGVYSHSIPIKKPFHNLVDCVVRSPNGREELDAVEELRPEG